ncbi:MAG: hypothetical protein AAGJ54_13030 [Planctomycetota bacterium]
MNAAVITKQGNLVAPNIEFRDDHTIATEIPVGSVVVKTLASALNHMDL